VPGLADLPYQSGEVDRWLCQRVRSHLPSQSWQRPVRDRIAHHI
jgi:hypothetical protein